MSLPHSKCFWFFPPKKTLVFFVRLNCSANVLPFGNSDRYPTVHCCTVSFLNSSLTKTLNCRLSVKKAPLPRYIFEPQHGIAIPQLSLCLLLLTTQNSLLFCALVIQFSRSGRPHPTFPEGLLGILRTPPKQQSCFAQIWFLSRTRATRRAALAGFCPVRANQFPIKDYAVFCAFGILVLP